VSFYQSTIGKKIVVAGTGLILFGFVIGHMLGNLQAFAGAEKINNYADFLKSNPLILWGTRILLLISVFFHGLATVQLTRINRASRPVGYQNKKNINSTFASRVMIFSGLLLAVFIVYHLLHFTVGVVHPNFDANDVYANMVVGFSVKIVSLFYILAMIALGLHLFHGVWSVFQTLGLNHEKYNCWRRVLAVSVAILITAGFISIPLAVMFKFIK